MNASPEHPTRGNRRWGLVATGFAALLVYSGLYPFSGWTDHNVRVLAFLTPGPSVRSPLVDVVANVVGYIPFGLLLARWRRDRATRLDAILIPALIGALVSFAIEFTQQFLPAREASLRDLLANTAGTAIGAYLAGVILGESLPWTMVMRWRNQWFRSGRLADLGLIAILTWTISQLAPLVPSVDLGTIRHGLSPVWQTLQHPDRFSFMQWATYALNIAGLGLLALTLAAPGERVFGRFFAFVACVLLAKIPMMTRQLSLEAATGALAALGLALQFRRLPMRKAAKVGASFIVCGFAVAELASDSTGTTTPFNWIPLAAHMAHELTGIEAMLDTVWPFAALAYLARFASPPDRQRTVRVGGTLLVALLAFGLEWYQQYLPGRYADITVVLLATGTWMVFWMIPVAETGIDTSDDEGPGASPDGDRRRTRIVGAAVGLIAATAVAAFVVGRSSVETRVDESKLPQLPAPGQLPPASLPGFRSAHPRLPSPSPADLAAIARDSPAFLHEVRARAAGGKGDFEAAALQAVIEPGSVDLDVLQRRLLELKFTWRGHEQVKPLAVAYDWLHEQWSEPQRAQLRGKLADGCDYVIGVIRKERLSPYNVFLYNSPLQALMACTLALYGDDPRGEPAMRFTADLWKSRVLPVWRQVMGTNGGWHEGGEYVGIGIGQAVYELPAMWRRATGEDLLAAEAGIRGFPDFLVYRTRPDGSDYRWGDGAYFDRTAPDATALALEYRNAAAYSLHPPGKEASPSGWPWGPLTDRTLYDPAAIARLPLTRYFDGIGMVVARSDWSPDATYVTFKAGDNYWSHTHLDQGAFTIYKGGELAIDSGLYGPSYGSDHHMNYAYQAIAHNTITVTDPADTVPAPGKEQPRPIANDGGQRRIGSGWGVEAAPLDLAEWQAKRDIYHTAMMEKVFDQDGLTVALADVTPAYTNSLSGAGTFSHRTRRVERFWRTFGYDRVDDDVVVFDQVTATDAAFRKRWLLHTIEAPQIDGQRFRVTVGSRTGPGRGGGHLEGTVLLPRKADITAIGGPGHEFFVDNKNYDENGKLQTLIQKLGPNRGEPGAWRIEISPPQDTADTLFLVVLLPTAGTNRPTHRVRLLESGRRVGCEIVGPERTTRWWFDPARSGAEIEVVAGGATRRYTVEGRPAPPPPPPGRHASMNAWLDTRQQRIRSAEAFDSRI